MTRRRQGLHEDLARQEPLRQTPDRSFGFLFAFVFVLLALIPAAFGHDVRWWALRVAAGFFAVALIVPQLLHPLNWLWTRFGLLLHHVVNPVVTGVLFFLVVTPFALVMRLFGRDVLKKKFDPAVPSYWITRTSTGTDPDGLKNQF